METEEQQVERIKEFWAEHGKGIVAGLLLGFAIFYGWRYYDGQVTAAKEAQSEQFEQVITALASDNAEAAEAAAAGAQDFLKANANSTYGQLVALELARVAVEKDDLATAVSALQVVRDNAQGGLKAIADVRQARVLNAQGQYDSALAALQGTDGVPGFAAVVHELRGDINLAKGDVAAARSAYEAAVAAAEGNRSLAEAKLKSIPAAS